MARSEKGKIIEVTFGLWKNRRVGEYLVTAKAQNGKTTITNSPLGLRLNKSFAGRIHWVGDLEQSYAAFQLTNVTKADQRTFGCKIRVEVGFMPEWGERGIKLVVLVSTNDIVQKLSMNVTNKLP